MEAKVGSKVICTGVHWGDIQDEHGNDVPMSGVVYTIRGFFIDEFYNKLGIWLEEIVNEPRPCEPTGRIGEVGWDPAAFRLMPQLLKACA